MTFEEEIVLARRIAAGDSAARNALILPHLRYVVVLAKIVRAGHRGVVPLDDLIQEGNLGLIRASKDFDPDQGFRFVTYARRWIKGFMLRAIRRAEHPAGLASLAFDPPELLHGDDDPRPGLLALAIASLNPVEAWVVRARYGLERARPSGGDVGHSRTFAELADLCGLTIPRIKQILVAALDKLKATLAGMEAT